MMKLWLLIPVKPFRESKSRLAPVLDAGERAALSRQLLDGIIALGRQSQLFADILVVSRDRSVRAIARRHGVLSLDETSPAPLDARVDARAGAAVNRLTRAKPPSRAGVFGFERENQALRADSALPDARPEARLNRALTVGQARAQAGGAEAVLVLPADLPLVSLDDLHALVTPAQQAGSTGALVLAPSHDGGTNALLLYPPGIIPFAFGSQSFARHRALAQAAGCTVTVVRTPSLTYDLDLPEDLWGEDLGI